MPSTDERVKILLDVVVKNQKELEKVKQEFSALKSSLRQVAETSKNTASALQRIATNVTEVKKQTSSLHSAFRGLVWTIVRAEIIIRGLLRIVNLIKDSFLDSIHSVEEFKQSIIGLAAVQTMLASSVLGKKELAEYYKAAKEQASSFYKQLLALSAQTPVTTQQLFRLVTLLQAYGQEVDLSVKKHREGLLALANAIYTVTQGQRLELQLLQETRALMGQSNKQSATLLQILRAVNPEIEEQLKLWKEQGTIVPHLAELLYPFTYAAEDLKNTWTGITQATKSVFQILKKEAFGDWYNTIVGELKSFVNALYDLESGKIQPLGQALIYTFKSVADSILILKNAFDSLTPSANTVATALEKISQFAKFVAAGVYDIVQGVKLLVAGFRLLGDISMAIDNRLAGRIKNLPKEIRKAFKEFEKTTERIKKDTENMYRRFFPELYESKTGPDTTKITDPIVKVFEKIDKMRATLMASPIKIKATLDISELESQEAEIENRLQSLKKMQQDIISGLVEKGKYFPWEVYGENWKKLFDASNLNSWVSVLEEYAKRGDEQAKKIIQQIKLIQAQIELEQKHLDTIERLKALSYEKEKLTTEQLQARTDYGKQIIQIKQQILEIDKDLATITNPKIVEEKKKQKKILQDELEILKKQAQYQQELERQARKITETLKGQDEVYEKIASLRNELTRNQISPLQQWLYGDVFKLNEIKGKITQLHYEAITKGLDVTDDIKALEELAEQAVNPWVKFKNRVEEIFVETFTNLHDIVVNWITNLEFDLGNVVQLFRRAVAEIVVSWASAFAKASLVGMALAPSTAGAAMGTGSTTPVVPGAGSLLTGGLRGLTNFFQTPYNVFDWLFTEKGYEWAGGPAYFFQTPLGAALGAGLMSGATTLLFTGDVKKAGLAGLGSSLGFAAGGPVGALVGGIGGAVLGGLFGGKKKAPRVTFDAQVVVDFVPGKGFEIASFELDTRRKYGAKPEYEQQVRELIGRSLNQPIEWLSSTFSSIFQTLPKDISNELEIALSKITFEAELTQRTHQSLGGDIDARPFERFTINLLRNYSDAFDRAFHEQLAYGAKLFEQAAPYLTTDVKKWLLSAVEDLFPEDVFDQLENIPIEKIKGADFGKWLEENIKPLFDDIETWNQFYEWAINYLQSVLDAVTGIRQKIHELAPELYPENVKLTATIGKIAPAAAVFGVTPEQIRQWVNQGLAKPFLDVIWNLKDNMPTLEKAAEAAGISVEDLINAIYSLGEEAVRTGQRLKQIEASAMSVAAKTAEIFNVPDFERRMAQQQLGQLFKKYGLSENDWKQLYGTWVQFVQGNTEAAEKINEWHQTWDPQAQEDFLKAIELQNKILEEAHKGYQIVNAWEYERRLEEAAARPFKALASIAAQFVSDIDDLERQQKYQELLERFSRQVKTIQKAKGYTFEDIVEWAETAIDLVAQGDTALSTFKDVLEEQGYVIGEYEVTAVQTYLQMRSLLEKSDESSRLIDRVKDTVIGYLQKLYDLFDYTSSEFYRKLYDVTGKEGYYIESIKASLDKTLQDIQSYIDFKDQLTDLVKRFSTIGASVQPVFPALRSYSIDDLKDFINKVGDYYNWLQQAISSTDNVLRSVSEAIDSITFEYKIFGDPSKKFQIISQQINELLSGLSAGTIEEQIQKAERLQELVLERWNLEIERIRQYQDLLKQTTDIIARILGENQAFSYPLARAKYGRLLAAAQTGEPGAVRKFLQFAPEFVDIAKRYSTYDEFKNIQYQVVKNVGQIQREIKENQKSLESAFDENISVLNKIRGVLEDTQDNLLDAAKDAASRLEEIRSAVDIRVEDLKGAYIEGINNLINYFDDPFLSKLGQLLESLQSKHSNRPSGGGGSSLAIARSVSNAVRSAYRAVRQEGGDKKTASIAGTIAGYVAGNVLQRIKSALGLAEGGIVTAPTFAFLAERGYPEAVIPLNRGNVFESLSDEIRKLREENRKLREDIVKLNYLIIKNTKRTSDTLEKWDKTGMPTG